MAIYLMLLIGGILLLVAGLFVTRVNWRPDVEPFRRGSPTLEILIHPERFATRDRLLAIRLLNALGAALVASAVIVLAAELVSVALRG